MFNGEGLFVEDGIVRCGGYQFGNDFGWGGWVYGEVSSVPVEMNLAGDSLPDKGCRGEGRDVADFRRGDGGRCFEEMFVFISVNLV